VTLTNASYTRARKRDLSTTPHLLQPHFEYDDVISPELLRVSTHELLLWFIRGSRKVVSLYLSILKSRFLPAIEIRFDNLKTENLRFQWFYCIYWWGLEKHQPRYQISRIISSTYDANMVGSGTEGDYTQEERTYSIYNKFNMSSCWALTNITNIAIYIDIRERLHGESFVAPGHVSTIRSSSYSNVNAPEHCQVGWNIR